MSEPSLYNLPYRFYKFMAKHPMGTIPDTAQTRLAMIEFFYQMQDVSVVCQSFNISRKKLLQMVKAV